MTETASRPTSATTTTLDTARRIVVGVDGSPGSRAAMKWAVREARFTGATIEAVEVFAPVIPIGAAGAMVSPVIWSGEDMRTEALATIDRVVRETASGDGPSVRRVAIEDHSAGPALVRRATGASMLVVGAHEHHGLGVLLGSTGANCVRHAKCPVVVVPESWDPTERIEEAGS